MIKISKGLWTELEYVEKYNSNKLGIDQIRYCIDIKERIVREPEYRLILKKLINHSR